MNRELSPTSFIVLALIDRLGVATPYALKRAAASQIGDFWSLAHSQLYAESKRLLGAGYLTAECEPHGRRRRLYALTDKGRASLAEWLGEPTTDRYQLRDPGLLKLVLGAPIAPLAAAQLELHRQALERYEQLASTTPADAHDRRALALHAGIGHEREYVRFWASLLAGADTIARDLPAHSPTSSTADRSLENAP
jgi:DNA-binding PadR family transcriptional regulator